MKQHLTVPTKRKPLASRAFLSPITLLALLLLALPGSAWAQATLSGQVKYSDGTVAAGATVYASSSGGSSVSATVDASGMYVLYLAPDTYNISIQISSSGFYGSQTLLSAQPITANTQQNLTVPDITLNGRIVNSVGQPVAGVQLYGYGYLQNGSAYLSPYSGSDGRFQVRILPATYSSLQLSPPSGSPYPVTPLPSETFSTSTTRDFVLADPVSLSGQVKYSDGTVAAGAMVYASSSGGSSASATVDASGMYVLYLAPDTYNISIQISSSGFYGSQTLLSAQPITANTQQNLTVPDITLNGRIVNSVGQPVAGVQLYGYGYLQNGSAYLSPYSGSDGRFQVRILPATYSSLQLSPPSGSPYPVTPLPSETFSTSTTRDFVLADPVSLSGQVKYSDGTVAAGAMVYASSSGGSSASATVDASGMYVLYLAPDTYNISIQISSSGFYGSQTLLSAQPITANTQQNLTVPDITLNGRIVNSVGQPVAGVQLYGYGYLQNGSAYLSPYSGSDGRFQVRILPATYSSLQLSPPSGSGYLQTPLPSETFSTSVSRDYVVVDLDECGYNNGGCSENATCTNIPGSRTCTCNSGYTGDGITCQAQPARVILNEILANEPGSSTTGEFVELVNTGGSSIDISGWTVSDATSVRHTFASGTVLAPGKAVVVFGGASAIPSGLSNAVAASTGTLSLANASDTVTVKTAANESIDTFTYPSSLASADGVSMNRSQDATPGTGFVLHNSISSLSSSAGKRFDGTSF